MLAASPSLAHARAGQTVAAVQLPATEPQRRSPGLDHPAGQEAKKVDIILPHISD